jgi:hypothetical protein
MSANEQQPKLEDHIVCIGMITAAYAISMLFVNAIVVPVQKLIMPETAVIAAFLFPGHGVRVLSAWLFGWKSIPYLICATLITHLLLEGGFAANINLFYTTILVSSVAWVAFLILRTAGINIEVGERHNTLSTWRLLLLVGFISSVLNSIGHNLILAGVILPEESAITLVTFMIGDTLGTFFSFIILMSLFRYFRKLKS